MPLSFGPALLQGLAPDGGLYIPESWPHLPPEAFAGAEALPDVAMRLLTPFVRDDPIAPALSGIVQEAFNFPAPLVPLEGDGRL